MSLESVLAGEQGQQWLTVCRNLGVELPDSPQPMLGKLARFYDLLVEANRHVNLTRITDPLDFLYRHILDAWVLSPFLDEGASVADVGSGAGFPAIPLALLRPDLSITAIEATGKKCRFIEQAKETLALDNLQVLNERSEILGRDPSFREHFSVVTARAVAGLPTLLELCIPLAEVDGMLLAAKGPKYEEELEQAGKALHMLNTEFEKRIELPLDELPPEYARQSFVLIFRKDGPTNLKYPRAAGLPSKKPL